MTAQSVSKPSLYIQNTNVETTKLDDEWILLNLDQFTVTKINEAGGYLWSLLHVEQTVDSLYEAVSHEIAKHQIDGFLSELLDCGVIQHVN